MMNDEEKIIAKLIDGGNDAEWARQAVEENINYLDRVYRKCSIREAATIIRAIA